MTSLFSHLTLVWCRPSTCLLQSTRFGSNRQCPKPKMHR